MARRAVRHFRRLLARGLRSRRRRRWAAMGALGSAVVIALAGALLGSWPTALVGLLGLQLVTVAALVLVARGGRNLDRSIDARAPHAIGPSLAATACVEDHVRIAKKRGQTALENTALRIHSTQVRDVLAHAATHGQLTYRALEAALERLKQPALRTVTLAKLLDCDTRWLMSTARVVALQGRSHTDRSTALAAYDLARDIDQSPLRLPTHALTYSQLLIGDRRFGDAAAVLDKAGHLLADRAYLAADLKNPFAGADNDEAEWLRVLNRNFSEYGLEQIHLIDDPELVPFDRVRATPSSHVADGPLVSVVMTTFNPGVELDIAIESVLAQSWRNLELLIIDDGSHEQHHVHLDKWEGRDERVKITRLPVNQGTYSCRNVALDQASGDFVTFQDADDWAHPRRLERQLEPMLADENVVATRSTCARTTEDLLFSWVGYRPTRYNASSLMFRRKTVLSKIGYFDPVRKAADTEYHRRVLAVFENGNVDLDAAPLALVRMDSSSLSRSDFRPGWHAPARVAYHSAYGHWHDEIAAGKADPYLDPNSDRAFATPRRFLPDPGEATTLDVVLAGDWRKYGGPQRSMIEEIKALTSAGMRVGVAHFEALRFMTSRMDPLCAPVQELINQGVVQHVLPDDSATTRVLIVRYPPTLQFRSANPVNIQADKVLVLANQGPYEQDGTDHRYDVNRCTENAREMFGMEPMWVPQGPMVRDLIEPLIPYGLLADFDLPGIIDVDEWHSPRDHPRGAKPIIGRHSRDDAIKWPNSPGLLASAYPTDGAVEVNILGGARTPARVLGFDDLPSSWKVWEFGEIDSIDFLAGIDFFVYYHHPLWVESFGRVMLEAMASGAVAVLPPHFERVFGSGPVYVPAKRAMQVVRDLHGQPELYREHSRQSVQTARERFSYQSYADRITAIVGDGVRRVERSAEVATTVRV